MSRALPFALLAPLFVLAACAAPVVDDGELACSGERARFCGPEGIEVSPPPPSPERAPAERPSDLLPTRGTDTPAPTTALTLRPAPRVSGALGSLPPR